MLNNTLKGSVIVAILTFTTVAQASWKEIRQCNRTQLINFPGTITEAAVATPELSILTALVVEAGLADALSQPGNFTVFAPRDEAFLAIPGALLDALGALKILGLADGEATQDEIDIITQILTYHVVPRRVDPRKSFFRRNITTLQGQKLFNTRRHATPMINQSVVDCQGVRTTNGTVWFIDSVLLPQFK